MTGHRGDLQDSLEDGEGVSSFGAGEPTVLIVLRKEKKETRKFDISL